MSGIKLLATGSALPERVVTNEDMARLVDTSDEWIVSRTGIHSRRHCGPRETHTGLCLAAARQALERSGVGPEAVGVCLVATLSADCLTPATACVLQRELGLAQGTVCFDLNAACSGFVYALHTAQCLLAASRRKVGLVIGAAIGLIAMFVSRPALDKLTRPLMRQMNIPKLLRKTANEQRLLSDSNQKKMAQTIRDALAEDEALQVGLCTQIGQCIDGAILRLTEEKGMAVV